MFLEHNKKFKAINCSAPRVTTYPFKQTRCTHSPLILKARRSTVVFLYTFHSPVRYDISHCRPSDVDNFQPPRTAAVVCTENCGIGGAQNKRTGKQVSAYTKYVESSTDTPRRGRVYFTGHNNTDSSIQVCFHVSGRPEAEIVGGFAK